MFKLRIVEYINVPAGELLGNDGNWRIHPLAQKSAVSAMLQKYGIVDNLKAYRSERHGWKLVLLDGHLRQDIDRSQVWPVAVLDLNDQEADELLSMYDEVTTWAQRDVLKQNELLQKVLESARSDKPLTDAINRVKAQIQESVNIAKAITDPAEPQKKQEDSGLYGDMKERSVKVVVIVGDDLDIVERALKAAGLRSRGQALVRIAQHFLDYGEHDGG